MSIYAKKSLGQHFLSNYRFLLKIFNAATLDNNDVIVEIGPGTGVLTKLLLNYNKPLYVIETDERCVLLLKQKFPAEQFEHLHIIHADALKFDFATIPGLRKILIANLPYNISVPLMLNYLENTSLFTKYCVLIQKEVADRLNAKIRTKDYGRLSVMAQAFCDVKVHFDVPGNAFTPTTKVTSSFISLIPHERYKDIVFDKLSKIVEQAFQQRRKMIRVVLKNTILLECLLQNNIAPTCRAEEICVQDYIKCCQSLD